MKTYEVRIYIIKWGIELGYIMLENMNINILTDLISRGYSIKPASLEVSHDYRIYWR